MKAKHYWVKTKDGCKLDCMFFRSKVNPPANIPKKVSVENLDGNINTSQKIKEIDLEGDEFRPTFIICNANGMYY